MAAKPPGKPRHKLPGADFSLAEGLLEAASVLIIPEDQGQREAFERLMPQLYVLRNKGCSFPQITNLLTQVGFKLQPSTVRIYYNEILATRMDICQSWMNEQIVLMAEIRKETKGAKVGDMMSRVAEMMEKQRAQVALKIDSVLGSVAGPVSRDIAHVSPLTQQPLPPPVGVVSPAITPSVENQKTGLRPAPQSQTQSPPIRASDVMPITAVNHKTVGFSENPNLRCAALPDGVTLLDKRDNMPPGLYLPGDMEHPAVRGLMLSLDQRLSSVALKFIDIENGDVRIETADEKRFRVLWRKTIPPSKSSTAHNFTVIDESLFRPR